MRSPPSFPRSPDSFSEEERLQALLALGLLDTQEEDEYGQLVYLASQICATPISLVSLVDQNRQWFKAAFGLNVRETPRSISFCAHAIQQRGLFVVEDASKDARFQRNSLVTGAPDIRFYAGIPIHAPGGAPVGTLCVIDTQPRILTPHQRKALTILGDQVEARMDLRRQRAILEEAMAENTRLNEGLRTANTMFRTFMDNGPFMSYVKDPEGRFVFYNQPLSRQFGIGPQEWIGKRDHDLFPAELADSYRCHDLDVANSGEVHRFAETTIAPNGDKVNWDSYKFPIQDIFGRTMIAGISLDVTETLAQSQALAAANVELNRLATTDELTGLFNRRFFQSRIEAEFSVTLRKARHLTLMIIDVDNFKLRNDKYGHAAGDEALTFLGGVLRHHTRKGELAARLGGEEFALLLPDTQASDSLALAGRIQSALRDDPAAPADLNISIGIASTDARMKSWEELFARSDEALYLVKRSGKNRVMIHPSQATP